jgi:hypothetical protein
MLTLGKVTEIKSNNTESECSSESTSYYTCNRNNTRELQDGTQILKTGPFLYVTMQKSVLPLCPLYENFIPCFKLKLVFVT